MKKGAVKKIKQLETLNKTSEESYLIFLSYPDILLFETLEIIQTALLMDSDH